MGTNASRPNLTCGRCGSTFWAEAKLEAHLNQCTRLLIDQSKRRFEYQGPDHKLKQTFDQFKYGNNRLTFGENNTWNH